MAFRKDFLWGGATAANQYEGGYYNAKEASTVVGIVAEEDEPYIDLFMSVLKNTETLKDSYKFILLSEEDAQKKFDKGEVSVVFIVTVSPSKYAP